MNQNLTELKKFNIIVSGIAIFLGMIQLAFLLSSIALSKSTGSPVNYMAFLEGTLLILTGIFMYDESRWAWILGAFTAAFVIIDESLAFFNALIGASRANFIFASTNGLIFYLIAIVPSVMIIFNAIRQLNVSDSSAKNA